MVMMIMVMIRNSACRLQRESSHLHVTKAGRAESGCHSSRRVGKPTDQPRGLIPIR